MAEPRLLWLGTFVWCDRRCRWRRRVSLAEVEGGQVVAFYRIYVSPRSIRGWRMDPEKVHLVARSGSFGSASGRHVEWRKPEDRAEVELAPEEVFQLLRSEWGPKFPEDQELIRRFYTENRRQAS